MTESFKCMVDEHEICVWGVDEFQDRGDKACAIIRVNIHGVGQLSFALEDEEAEAFFKQGIEELEKSREALASGFFCSACGLHQAEDHRFEISNLCEECAAECPF